MTVVGQMAIQLTVIAFNRLD